MIIRLIAMIRDTYLISKDPVAFFRRLGVTIGSDCRLVGLHRAAFGSEPYLIKIGDRVTITSGVNFVTHDGAVHLLRNKYPNADLFGPIIVEDNVMIGLKSTILPSVRIGQGSIVAAGSVVTRSVPPGTVVGGVPARTICSTDDYLSRAETRIVNIRNMDQAAKREILLDMFHDELKGESKWVR